MPEPNIAVIGAGGFVGSALCERLYFEEGPSFRAVVRSMGNTARIARFPIELRPADMLDYEQTRKAIRGCSTVINCALGDDRSMISGLANLLRACRAEGVQRFIHISSIAIYGEDPAAPMPDGMCKAQPTNEYGVLKARQDKMVLREHRRGLPSVILCPGHITGPYSPFILGTIQKLRENRIALVDGGRYPTNHIHVDNLVEAIRSVLRHESACGRRYLITENPAPSWAEFYTDLRKMLGLTYEFREASREAVLQRIRAQNRHPGLRDNVRVLLSGEFRRAMSMMPWAEGLNRFASTTFHRFPSDLQRKIKRRLRPPTPISPASPAGPDLGDRHIAVQVRRFHFAPSALVHDVAYQPVLTYSEGVEAITRWCRFANMLEPEEARN